MKRGSRLVASTERRHYNVGWFTAWLVFWAGWLALTGCGTSAPAPTLIPTLILPTPSITPSPPPAVARPTPTPFATNFPTWRTATLQDRESFDFRQETSGLPTEGDLYYSAFSSRQGSACLWANNVEQVGGRDLGSWPLTALTERPLPRDRYSGQCIPVIRGHVYVYGIRGDERLAVFRVADTGPTSVTIQYILRK
jgi:hypothetical protein